MLFSYHTLAIYIDWTPIGYTFRADGRYFIVAERHRSKDTLGIYDATETYRLVRVRSSHIADGDLCPYTSTPSISPFQQRTWPRSRCRPAVMS
jgi:hypothetical protein